jgi:protein-export membrane protein SecD/preprotein translocase SecF subunit
MNDREMWWKISIVGALCALAFAAIWPLDQKLKYGIDLYGGYSLLYEIDDTGVAGGERAELSEKVMRVLRGRVDPKGVFNLVWRPVGFNRLEIQMPRPSEDVRAARQDYERFQDELRQSIVTRSDVLRTLAKPMDQRTAAFGALVRGVPSRTELLQKAAKAYDEYKSVEAEYVKLEKRVSADNLSEAQINEALAKPSRERKAALDALVGSIPARKAQLESAAKAWDELQSAKTSASSASGPKLEEARKAEQDKQKALDSAVAKVLEANVDPNKVTDGLTLNRVIELEDKFNAALSDVLSTNVDLGALQATLELRVTDKTRIETIKKMLENHASLAAPINGIVSAFDRLRTQRRGEGRLEDPADLQRLLKGAGVLEFRILPTRDPANPDKFNRYVEALKVRGPRLPAGESNYQWFELEDPKDFLLKRADTSAAEDLAQRLEEAKKNSNVIVERFGDKYYVLADISEGASLTHRPGEPDWSLRSARFQRDENSMPAIGFTLDERGGDKFAVMTRVHKGHQLAIFLDDQCISQATIQSVIRTDGQIHGSFTVSEVREMVKKLDAGSLPRKLKDPPISVRAIGPSLGEANRTAGLTAAKYGAFAVVVFMIGYYFYAGGIAVIATSMNLLFTLAIMASMGATVTLPGIAGLVLAIGMSVDANVLIYERMREELQRGTAMRMSVKLGYDKAFSAILDSNVTTMLTCLILYFLGSEEIKGFGLTLGIGVVINMFTAYLVTKMFFETMVMTIIPKEVTRYAGLVGMAAAAGGGLIFAAGYYWNQPEARAQSVLMSLGSGLFYIGPGIIGLMLLMFIVRAIHAAFQTGDKPRMPMMNLVGVPKIDWLGMKPIFFGVSIVVTVIGIVLFSKIPNSEMYDIEFLGGTAAQVDLKSPGSLTSEQITKRLETSSETLGQFSAALSKAEVSGSGDQYTVKTPGVPAARLEPVLKSVLDKKLSDIEPVRYSDPAAEEVVIRTRAEAKATLDDMKQWIAVDCANKFKQSAEAIGRAQVQAVQSVGGTGAVNNRSFEVVSLETNKELVVGAIMENLQSDLDIQPALSFKLLTDASAGGVPYFPVKTEDVRELTLPLQAGEAAGVDLVGWKGSVAIVLDKLNPPQSVDILKSRLRSMRLQPGFESHGWRESDVVGLSAASPGSELYSRVMVLVLDTNYPLEDDQGGLSSAWVTELAEPEVELIQAALQRQTSLSQITQFDKQVSGEAQRDAYLAVMLSWLVIIIYVWFRFGNLRWGLAAVVALVHDIVVALSCIALCHYVADTAIGRALMLEQFRFDLSMVAALLTVIGYSVNDTIVVFDRIRENRGRLKDVTGEIVNDSISQTLGRTLLTGTTTFFTIIIMYVFGGPGIHGFNFALFIGILTGTYSSFAIASQLLVKRRAATA